MLDLCPRQEAVLIRHTARERYRSEEKTVPWANALSSEGRGEEMGQPPHRDTEGQL